MLDVVNDGPLSQTAKVLLQVNQPGSTNLSLKVMSEGDITVLEGFKDMMGRKRVRTAVKSRRTFEISGGQRDRYSHVGCDCRVRVATGRAS